MTYQPSHVAYSVTAQTAAATQDGGPGSGWVPADCEFVSVTSSSSAKFVILSDKFSVGAVVRLWVGANGFKLGTLAASTDLINNVDTSGGTASAAIPTITMSLLTKVAANTWTLQSITKLGAVATAIVPS